MDDPAWALRAFAPYVPVVGPTAKNATVACAKTQPADTYIGDLMSIETNKRIADDFIRGPIRCLESPTCWRGPFNEAIQTPMTKLHRPLTLAPIG
jgi:hypothetical protein